MFMRNKGFTLIELMIVLVIIAIAMVALSERVNQQALRSHASGIVANRISEVVNATRMRVAMAGALNDFPLATQTFVGTAWLKDIATCPGGGAPTVILPCITLDIIPRTGGLTYTTTVTNVAGVLDATVVIADGLGVGYSINGQIAPRLSGVAAATAMGVFQSSNTPAVAFTFANITSDPATAVITATINSNPGNDIHVRTDGLNTMNADFTFGGLGSDIVNANTVNGTDFVDKDNPLFNLDPDTNSNLSNLNITDNLTAQYMIDGNDGAFFLDPDKTSNLNGLNAENITANTAGINFIGANMINSNSINATDISSQTSFSDMSGSRVHYDNDDVSFFINADGESRMNDIVLSSRGNVKLSELLPNYSLKESVIVENGDAISIPNCGLGVPRIMLIPRTGFIKLRETTTDHGQSHDNTALDMANFQYYVDISGSDWIVRAKTNSSLTFDQEDGGVLATMLAHIYCQYT